MKTQDPVLDALRRAWKAEDKRTWEGKYVAGQINDIIQAVEAEREEWSLTTQELQSEIAKVRSELTHSERLVEELQLVDEQTGYTHEIKPGEVYADFKVGQIEEAMIRLRMAGANERTPVKLGHRKLTCDTRLPLPLPFEEEREIKKAREREALKKRWTKIGIITAVSALGPFIVLLFAAGLFRLYTMTLGFF